MAVIHKQFKMVSAGLDESFFLQLSDFCGQTAPVDGQVIGKLLTAERNLEGSAVMDLRLGGQIGEQTVSCSTLPDMTEFSCEKTAAG